LREDKVREETHQDPLTTDLHNVEAKTTNVKKYREYSIEYHKASHSSQKERECMYGGQGRGKKSSGPPKNLLPPWWWCVLPWPLHCP
jgi:hypothetical protein